MLKKALSLMLIPAIVLMMISVFSLSASAAQSGSYTYELLKDGTAEITGYSGSETVLKIPSTLEGHKVTSIGDYAFNYNFDIEEIYFPDTVTSIGFAAVADCPYISNVYLPEGLVSVGAFAFENDSYLYEVHIPRSVTDIGIYAFGSFYQENPDTGEYERVVDTDSFFIYGYRDTAAHQYANRYGITFRYESAACGDYNYSVLNDGTAEITAYIGSAKELTLPKKLDGYTVSGVSDGAFAGNKTLKTVRIPSNIKDLHMAAFYLCTSLENVEFSEGLEYMASLSFQSCTSLHRIYLPRSLKSLQEYAFGFFFYNYEGAQYYVHMEDFSVFLYQGKGPQAYCDAYGVPYKLYRLGDADLDEDVTILDATATQRHLAELGTKVFHEISADADEDGEVTIFDATSIQRCIADLPTHKGIGDPIPLIPAA